MFKVVAFLVKKDGMSIEEFSNYYENHHVPLVLSIASPPLVYKRRYLTRSNELTQSGNVVDFDAITEIGFEDEASFHENWLTPLVLAETGKAIAEDEEGFIDRAKTRAYMVDEYATCG
jgi:uncharacterized protein (TIGR02118 family)